VLSIFFIGAAGYFDSRNADRQRADSESVRNTQVSRDLELFRLNTPLAEVSLGSHSSVITEGLLNRRMVESGMTPDKMKDIPDFYRETLRSSMVEQLVNEELMFLEGKNQGIDVEAAVLSQVETIRQRQGGGEMFTRLLQANGFADEDDFRAYLRRGLMLQNLRDKLFEGRTVTDEDVEFYYRVHRDSFKDEAGNHKPLEQVKDLIRAQLRDQVTEEDMMAYYEKHKPRWQKPKVIDVRYIAVREDSERFSLPVDSIDETAVQSYYNANKNEFLAPEKVGLELLYIDKEKLRSEFVIVEDELTAYYKENELRYYEEAQVKASHILVSEKTQGTEEDALKFIENLKADILTKKIEFAEAAKLYGGSGSQGGSLGVFYRGEMTGEFDEYCFTGPVGVLSEPVKTTYGYHLIFVEERIEARQKSFEEVREEVKTAVVDDNIGLVADDIIDTILLKKQEMNAAVREEKEKMLAERRKNYPESVNRTLLAFVPLHEKINSMENPGFGQYAEVFSHAPSAAKAGFLGQVLLGDGNSPEAIAEISSSGDKIDYPVLAMLRTLKTGEISDMVETGRGYYLLRIRDREAPEVRPLSEVQEQIKKMLTDKIRRERFQKRIATIKEELAKGTVAFGDLAAANSDSKTAAQGGLVEGLRLDPENSPIGYGEGVREDLFSMGKIDEKVFALLQYLPEGKVSEALDMGDKVLFFHVDKIHPGEFEPFVKVKQEIEEAMTLKVSEAEIRRFYNENINDYVVKPRIVLQQILYRDEETAKNQLQAIQKGLSFDKAGESHMNMDRSNFMTNRGKVELENVDFLDVATRAKVYALNDGEVLAEPVKSAVGYSLIKLLEKSDERTKTLEEVTDAIVQKLKEKRREEIFESYLKELRNKAANIKMMI
jgi:peptidyl-prolyl cis-trans isomerase C